MRMRPPSRQGPDGTDRTFRTLPARVTGWLLVAACVVLAVLLARAEQERQVEALTPVAVMALVIAVVWMVLLRPSVRITASGVRLQNLVTDVDVPFEHLAEAGDRWSLELVDTAGNRHSSWAVPARREYGLRRPVDAYAEATTKGRSRESVHASHVLGHLEHARQRWELEGGTTVPGVSARRQVSWAAVGPVLGALLLVVVALLAF